MRKFRDITGLRVGIVKVLEPAFSKKGRWSWRCRCDCGKEFVRSLTVLSRKNNNQSCGCLRYYKSVKDLIDKNTQWQGECLIWKGAGDRYGNFEFRGKQYAPHRANYELKFGTIPKHLYACHKCNTPKCCNPEHIYLGTAQENANDKVRSGNSRRGEDSPFAILKKEQVISIINEYKNGNIGQRTLAKKYGVSRGCITGILKRKTWKNI